MLKKLHFKSLLLIAVMLLGGANVNAAEVTYAITAINTLSTTGTAPAGSSATIAETYSTSCQMTKGNTQTLTLKDYNGYRITKIVLSMKSNAKGGSGSLAYSVDGGKTFSYIVGSSSAGVAFNQSDWHGSWSTSYVDITKNVSIDCSSSDVVIKIVATANSLYCQSYTLTYESNGPIINAENVEISSSETTGEIPYTITNPSGATLTAAKTMGDWISNVAVDAVNSKVTFNATVNTGAERNGTITLSYTGAEDKVVTVTQAAPAAVSGVSLDITSTTLNIGETTTLAPIFTPANPSNKNVTWSSNNTSVATVSNGVVTAVGPGNATITVTTEDGGFTATCTVTVLFKTVKIVVWEEDWSTGSADDQPSDISNPNATYSQTGTYTKLWDNNNAGGEAPELLVAKSSRNESWTATINLNGVSGALTLAFKCNQVLDIESSTTGVVVGEVSKTGCTISVPENTSTLVLTFSMGTDSNARLDDIELSYQQNVVEVPVSDAGFATFCSAYALNFKGVDGLTAYQAVMMADGKTVKFTPVDNVPANTGVLVKAAEGTYNVPVVATSSTDVSYNKLVGVTKETVIGKSSDKGTHYVLKNIAGVGFYKVNNDDYKVRANSAYLALTVSTGGTGAKDFIPVDGTTAIELVDTANEVAAPVYNLQGQRVSEGYKGVVIVNGKKIMMK